MPVATSPNPLDAAAEDAIAAALEQAPPQISRADLAEHWRGAQDALRTKARTAHIPEVIKAAQAALIERVGEPDDDAMAAFERALTSGSAGGLAARAVDIGAVLRGGIPPVDYLPGDLARGMVYAVGVTGFAGHPKSGKTSLCSRLALDAMREGRHVVYLDYENGEDETARRFAALGAEPTLLSERLTYLPFPGAPNWGDLGALWDEHPDAVGVWDSTRGILRSLGLKENDAETGGFFDALVEFSLTRRVPSLLIDHVRKDETGATGYARGSGDKLAAIQGQWYVKCERAFSESEAGEIEVQRWAARSGRLARVHRLGVGDGAGNLTFRRLSPDESPEGRAEAEIIGFLRDAGEPCSLTRVEEGVSGTATRTRSRVRALADAPARPVTAVEGHGGHLRYGYDAELDQEPGKGEGLEF